MATEEEVLEYTGAYMQIYRERRATWSVPAHWIERVGLSHVKSRLLDDPAARRAAHERFLHSQKFAQIPRGERVADKSYDREFSPMEELA